jgi:hypothetical protein
MHLTQESGRFEFDQPDMNVIIVFAGDLDDLISRSVQTLKASVKTRAKIQRLRQRYDRKKGVSHAS